MSHHLFAAVSIATLALLPAFVSAQPTVAANSVAKLITMARAKPGALNCASAGTGTPNHLGCELLKALGGIKAER